MASLSEDGQVAGGQGVVSFTAPFLGIRWARTILLAHRVKIIVF